MADTTFSSGTVIASSWLNDTNKWVNRSVINVKLAPYNAVGNGVTDDTAAIQAAITAAALLNCNVHLPRGTYRTTSTITLSVNVSIVGDGRDGSVISYTGSSHAFSKVFGAHVGAANHMNAEYRHFGIQGTSSGGAGFYFEYADHWTVNDVDIQGFTNITTGAGVRMKECYWWHIHNSKMDEIGRAMVWMEKGSLTGCNAGTLGPRNRLNANGQLSCIGVEATGQQISIIDNDIEGGSQGLHAIRLVDIEGILIQGNYIEQFTGMAIKADNASTLYNRRVEVNNNVLNSAGTTICGFANSTPNDRVTFTNNRFADASGAQTCIVFGGTTNWNVSNNDPNNGVYSDKAVAFGNWCPMLHFTGTWDPASIASGGTVSTDFNVTSGVATNDRVIVTMGNLGSNNLQITGHVRAAGIIRVVLRNGEPGAVDLASGTVYMTVLKAPV